MEQNIKQYVQSTKIKDMDKREREEFKYFHVLRVFLWLLRLRCVGGWEGCGSGCRSHQPHDSGHHADMCPFSPSFSQEMPIGRERWLDICQQACTIGTFLCFSVRECACVMVFFAFSPVLVSPPASDPRSHLSTRYVIDGSK